MPGGGFIRLLDKSFKNLLDLAGDHILALELLQNLLTAKAVFGIFPANTVNNDDIEIYADADRKNVNVQFVTLRQQSKKKGSSLRPNPPRLTQNWPSATARRIGSSMSSATKARCWSGSK